MRVHRCFDHSGNLGLGGQGGAVAVGCVNRCAHGGQRVFGHSRHGCATHGLASDQGVDLACRWGCSCIGHRVVIAEHGFGRIGQGLHFGHGVHVGAGLAVDHC